MTDLQHATSTPTEVVERFLAAMRDGDIDAVLSLIDDDITYTNVSLPTIRGRARFAKGARSFYRRAGFDVRVHRIAADGGTVLTERTDQIIVGPVRAEFWVCGTFEVVDGRIRLWRDYFDWAAMAVALVRAVAAVAVPPLRARPLGG